MRAKSISKGQTEKKEARIIFGWNETELGGTTTTWGVLNFILL